MAKGKDKPGDPMYKEGFKLRPKTKAETKKGKKKPKKK